MNDVVAPQPIPLHSLLPWIGFALLLLVQLYLVGLEDGAFVQGGAVLHELMHDGRHLLAGPCH